MDRLKKLIESYNDSPEIYHATRYWKDALDKITKEIETADLTKMRSGQFPIFAKFGFYEYVYPNAYGTRFTKKAFTLIKVFAKKLLLPYFLKLSDIREMAFKHCIDVGKLSNAIPVTKIGTSTYGSPEDIFEIQGQKYTMMFLSYYLRYCFVQKHLNLKGNEIIVELGSGSGHQVEVLKKLYPDLTILCFDLPAQLYLCEDFLSHSLGSSSIVSADITLNYSDLNLIEEGKVHMLGNWQFPLLKNYKFDIFWNAASFGEMEPHVIENYLSYILGNAEWIYLLQARHGKESYANAGVEKPVTFNDYNQMLHPYKLVEEQDAYYAHMRMHQSGGYFEALWKKF
jgi:putative sugar O-methyltransferase